MNDVESVMWRAERHPSLSSTVVLLEILDKTPEWERFTDGHRWGSELVQRFRERVIDRPAVLGPPSWELDPGFDLSYHLRRVALTGAGGTADLMALVQSLALAPLDRSRALWEATLIEGLEDGRSAYLLKAHHSLSDGVAGIQLLAGIHSRTRERSPAKPVARPDRACVSHEPSASIGSLAGRLVRTIADAGPIAADALVRPRSTAQRGARVAGSLRRVLASGGGPPSPLLAARTGQAWRFEILERPLSDFKAAARATGSSLNDVYIAGLLGGLRRFHEERGVSIATLPVAMPVSLRAESDSQGGNRIAAAVFPGPIGIQDPRERIAAVRGIVLTARAEPALAAAVALAPVLGRLPSELALLARRRVGVSADLSASNFPGLQEARYLAGARVERTYAFGPLPGSALMATLVSHGGTCCIALNCDGSVIDDPAALCADIGRGLDEVLGLAS